MSALRLFFVDVVEELRACVLGRAVKCETMGSGTYGVGEEERLAEAAGRALAMGVAGVILVMGLRRRLGEAGEAPSSLPQGSSTSDESK